ncbi:MAG: heme exporter protein CcmD [Gammaproteobacteria bacterium]
MGGYGAYVWSAYGITLMVLVFNIWWAYRVHGKSLKKLNEVVGDFAKRQPIVRQVP